MSKSTRPPTALESELHQATLTSPNNELSAKAAESIIPDPAQRKDALNYLLAVGLLKPLKNSKGALIFRAVTRSEHTTNVGLSEEEKVVLGYIRGAQNEGIWVKHLKAKTNFHQTVLDRCIKTLEQKKLIKKVPSVQHPTRKIYMLEGLAPSVALTGGPWFTDGEFDTEFIETLMKACFKFIRDMSFPKTRGRQPDGALYPIHKAPKYPSAQQVRNALKQARLTETDLTVEHVEILLNVLVLDGEIEKLPAFGSSLWDSGTIDDNDSAEERRSKKKRKHQSSDTETDERSSRRKKNRKARTSDDSDSEENRSSRKNAKQKRKIGSDDSDATSSKVSRRKSKMKKMNSDVSDEESSDEELNRKRRSKGKKSRYASGASSQSDSDSADDPSPRSTSKSIKRSPSPFFSFDDTGSNVYRAIREERVSLGWSQAPCSGCPSFEFCKSGGPVNPRECVYYDDWLGGGIVAAIEDGK
ncbi:RNA polymerase Rpc34 [Lentinula detonsa]|uniref:RNA polymerase Rpc34 n=1 Tax=Lentinula detonsa TaxID=2804962 RepID=A0A9W8TV46_9AGAR|nr:RNA polymerase Rpc34 [Lentinula detonsa]KAJ3981528.1 RNA polymerase Rpc34 [Lentinula detonsa]